MYNETDAVYKRDISNDQFEFVQKGQKIYDQKIEGKPIGYMKDVWIRFRKNKGNLIASTILLVLIISSILLPGLSGKEFIKIDEKLSFLPPRMPILENFGVMDGTVYIEDKPVDLEAYDENTGLYLPLGFNHNAVVLDTLTNDVEFSNEKVPNVLHGQSVFKLDTDSNEMTVETPDFVALSINDNAYIELDVFEIDPGSSFEVLLQTDFVGEPRVIDTITTVGVHQIKVFDLHEDLYADIASKLQIRYVSENAGASASLTSVSIYDDTSNDPLIYDEGYTLATYKFVSGKGALLRQNGEMTIASFRFNEYIAAFDLTHELAFSSDEYDALLEEWGDDVQRIPNPDNPEGWYFTEGFPITEVVRKNDSVVVDGESYYSYELYLDYAAYLGYDELPYYLFGTTFAGRDLFSLVWVALRTSLLIGVIVTLINVTIGVIYGSIEGYYGGMVDLLMQRFSELIGRIPWLVVLAILVVLMQPGVQTLILVLVISGWIGTASVTRMQFYRYKGREYVLASKTMGAKDRRLIFRHILPNGVGTIITSSVLAIPGVIFTEAALSYLGFGIGHGQSFEILGMHFSGVSIGVLLSDARNFLSTYPYLTVFPAIIVSILMITFNLFGNALRDAFNPSLRGVE